jgi:hypothetical protein
LRAEQQTDKPPDDKKKPDGEADTTPVRHAPAKPHERELLEVLLSEPALVAEAQKHIAVEQVEHPGLRLLLEGMYRLLAEGAPPTLENLRTRIENYPLLAKAQDLQERGRGNTERRAWLARLVRHFEELRQDARKQELQQQLYTAGDHATALELLRQLQNRSS